MKRFLSLPLCALAVFAALGASAQPVLTPIGGDPRSDLTPVRPRGAGTATLATVAPTEQPSPFTWAGLSLLPHPLYRFMYSDGLLFRPGHPLNSYIQTVAPGVSLKAGEHWFLDYTPTWNFYSNRQFRDTLDHSARVTGEFPVGTWNTNVIQSYTSSSGVTVETARQTGQEIVFTSLGVSHGFNSHWGLELNGSQQLSFLEQTNDMFDWSGAGWLHYQPGSELDVSAGYMGGYIQIYHSPDLINSTPSVQITWRPLDSLAIHGQLGLQQTRFASGGRSPVRTVMYDGGIRYTPTDTTMVSVTLKRMTTPSFFTNDITQTKSWRVSLQQRLLQHFNLAASYSENRSHYILSVLNLIRDSSTEDIKDENGNVIGYRSWVTTTPVTTFVARDDVHRVVDLRLSTTWLKRGTFAVTYQNGRNHSSVVGYGFSSHQIGFEVGWKY